MCEYETDHDPLLFSNNPRRSTHPSVAKANSRRDSALH